MDTKARVAIFAIVEQNHYRGTEPWGNVTRVRAESMCRLTHVIPSVSIKDHTIIGAFVEIERMPLT